MNDYYINDFIEINKKYKDLTIGKYSAKHTTFFEDIKKWQSSKYQKEIDIRPLQYTVELTNKCNCNCKDCGMAANRLETKRSTIKEQDLIKLVDDLEKNGIPAYAITGGEPFLEFQKMCAMMNHSQGKIDVCKIISNGFWGKNVEYYFEEMEKNGLLKNNFFTPSMQISIGEQTIPMEYICNIIEYATKQYTEKDLNIGIIHTREFNKEETKLWELYKTYLEKYGVFPKNRVFLTDSYYVNSNPVATEKIDVPTTSVYHELAFCDNQFNQEIGAFVSPKIFMKCNGDCYPCEVFNIHQNMYLGNYFQDGLAKIIDNYNRNKYIRFIKDFGTIGFRDVIPKNILEKEQCETPCYACEYCIKFSQKHALIR